MRVLLTGATGFIGSHVARLLVTQGHAVTAVVRRQSSRWRLQDIESALQTVCAESDGLNGLRCNLERVQPEVCLHMAWESVDGWSASTNVDSAVFSLLMLRAALESGCRRIVVAGSCFEYEPAATPLSEESPVRPHDLYSASKHAVHLIAHQLAGIHGASLAWLRIFNTYGTHDDDRRLVPSVVRALVGGKIAEATAGEQIRDYTHVEDVASAVWTVATSSHSGPINIASGVPVTVRDLATTAARLVGKPEMLRLGVRPYRQGEPMIVRADVSRLRNDLGWAPRYDLERGLAQTVQWLRGRYG